MLHNVFLAFQDSNMITTQEQLFKHIKNTFTIEFWAKPEITHGIDLESRKGISKSFSKRFAITPVFGAYGDGDSSRAGVGVSVGTNGVSVYEHTVNYLPATLVYATSINDWTHIAVVYVNKRPTLYINGQFAKKGLASSKTVVVPSGTFGGVSPFGYYFGGLGEIRIWRTARTPEEIQKNMNRELAGSETGLFGYWKMNEGTGVIAHDSSINKNDITIHGAAKWRSTQSASPSNKSMNILFTFFVPSGGVETLNRQRYYALKRNDVNCHFLYTQSGTGLQNKIDTNIFVTNDDDKIKSIVLKGNYDAIVVCSDHLLLQKIKKFGYQGSLIYENQGLGLNKEFVDYFLKKHAHATISDYCDAILYPDTPHLIAAFENNFPFKKKFCFDNCFNTEEFKYQVLPRNNSPIIGWVGRLEENKNWKDFLLIGSQLIKENPAIQLWMFEDNTLGRKSERIAFEEKIDELNVRHNLTAHVNQPHDKMAEYFSIIGDSGGFLCSTSRVESFGYAVLEALICKCPVLTTDSDGVRSFIKHNETGKFFEFGNINQAVHEAKELMSDFRLREKIRRIGVKHIETRFSLDKYAENFLKMIHEIRK